MAYMIRAAFLKVVSNNEIHVANKETLAAMNHYSVTDKDLLNYMKYLQIEEIQLVPGDHVRFTIYPIHHGHQLRIVISAKGYYKSNNIQFWVMSVRSLS